VYVVVVVGVTGSGDPVGVPTSGAMVIVSALDTEKASDDDCPRTTVPGVAVKLLMVGLVAGAVTVTVAVALVVPPGPVAVSVYVVVWAGETVVVLLVTSPTSGAIDTWLAALTTQESVVDSPRWMVAGEAVNELTCGPGVPLVLLQAAASAAKKMIARFTAALPAWR
jgi:hypothetical protein